MVFFHDFAFDHLRDAVRFIEASMHHEPAWALWNVTPHEQNGHPQDCAHTKAEPPAQVNRQQVRVEQNGRQASTDRRADPPGAIDREIHVTTNARRNELINSGVNGRVLSTDTGTCQEAAGSEPDEVEG